MAVRGHNVGQEEVILFAIYYFPESRTVIDKIRERFPLARIIWHSVPKAIGADDDFLISEGTLPDCCLLP